METKSGYEFTGWGGDCAVCGKSKTCLIVMDADKICSADFQEKETFTPVADVKVNGSDRPITLWIEDVLNISVFYDQATLRGLGDYFLWVKIPSGECYCYDFPTNWFPCSCFLPEPAYQGELVSFENLVVYTIPAFLLPRGPYQLYFAVDGNMNGFLDPGAAQDQVNFEIVH